MLLELNIKMDNMKKKRCPRGCGKTLKIKDGEFSQPIIYNHYQKECPIDKDGNRKK